MRFGEDSRETMMIHNVLGEFRTGKISKRDTHSFILNMLDDHSDLGKDLMSIIIHEDARWGPGDFNLARVGSSRPPTSQTIPHLLQPAHEPAVRLPFLTAPWLMDTHQTQSVGLSASSDSNGPGVDEDLGTAECSLAQKGSEEWPTLAHIESHAAISRGFKQPMVNGSGNSASQIQMAPPYLLPDLSSEGLSQHNGYQSMQAPRYHEQRDNDTFAQQFDNSRLFSNGFAQPNATYDAVHDLEWPQLQHSMGPMASPGSAQQHVTQPFPSLQSELAGSSFDVISRIPESSQLNINPLSLVSRERIVSATQDKPRRIPGNDSALRVPPNEIPVAHQSASELKQRPTKIKAGGGGPFIHGLCGKGFPSRSKVKKHHWGSKIGDLNTTTGCWTKYQKPNVNWDDHPSCRQTSQKAHLSTLGSTPKRTNHNHMEPASVDRKAPVVPAMVPKPRNLVPGIRDHQDPFHAMATSFEPLRVQTRPQHTSRLSPGSSMDDLLTVVNAEVSSIEAPKPKGRNDSIVSNLNAQAELEEQQTQVVSQAQAGYGGISDYQDRQFPTQNSGFNLNLFGFAHQVPVDPVYSAYVNHDGYASSAVSPTDTQFGMISSPTPIHYGDDATCDDRSRAAKREREQNDLFGSSVTVPDSKKPRF